MSVEMIYYRNEDDKKGNKKLAEALELSIKQFGKVDVVSSKTNQVETQIGKKSEIRPGWNGIEIDIEEVLADYMFEKSPLIKEMVMGTVIDTKHENQELEAVDYILI